MVDPHCIWQHQACGPAQPSGSCGAGSPAIRPYSSQSSSFSGCVISTKPFTSWNLYFLVCDMGVVTASLLWHAQPAHSSQPYLPSSPALGSFLFVPQTQSAWAASLGYQSRSVRASDSCTGWCVSNRQRLVCAAVGVAALGSGRAGIGSLCCVTLLPSTLVFVFVKWSLIY